jgi:hypothetical protein
MYLNKYVKHRKYNKIINTVYCVKKLIKKIILYLNILASMAWVTRRITHHIIFFTCAIRMTSTTSIYSQSIALSGPN